MHPLVRLAAALRLYGVMPLRLLDDPDHALDEIRAQLRRQAEAARASALI